MEEDERQEGEEQGDQLEDLQEQLFKWKALVKSAGWQLLEEYAKAQVNHRVGSILRAPTREVVDVINREYERGECSGINLFQEMPQIEIARLEEEIRYIKEVRGNVD